MSTLPAWLFVLACSPPPDAPEEFEALSAYLFEQMGVDDERALEAGVANLGTWIAGNLDGSKEGYGVELLSQVALDALEGGIEREADKLVGGAVATVSTATIDQLVEALLQDDQVSIYPDTYDSFVRVYRDGGTVECFLSGACTELVADGDSVTRLPFGINLTSSYTAQYVWVDGPEGEPVLLTRSWLKEPSTSTLLRLEQQFFLSVNLRTDDGLVRVQGVWAEPELLGLDVPEATALNLLIDGLRDTDAALYEWLDR
ncbi:MAG: hypothetical protein AAF602_09805 [Myxococcota bacterium]